MCSNQSSRILVHLQMSKTIFSHAFSVSVATQVEGGGLVDGPGCLQLHRLHNHPVSCIDSCVSKASSLPERRSSDVEDPRPALKDGGGVWRELGPHQMFLSQEKRQRERERERSQVRQLWRSHPLPENERRRSGWAVGTRRGNLMVM